MDGKKINKNIIWGMNKKLNGYDSELYQWSIPLGVVNIILFLLFNKFLSVQSKELFFRGIITSDPS